MLLAVGIGAVIGLGAAITRGRNRGDWTPSPPPAPRVIRSAGRFLRGSGGDGWGGPKPASVWDQPRKDPWS